MYRCGNTLRSANHGGAGQRIASAASSAAGARLCLPLPEVQIFGGGAHAGRRVDVQDFMVIAVGARDYVQALEWTAEVYRSAGVLMARAGLAAGVADEGGHWPAFDTNEAALDFLLRAIEAAGYTPGQDVAISLDIAATDFGSGGRYTLARDGRSVDSDALSDMLLGWLRRYPIVAIEDPLAEDDAQAWQRFTSAAGAKVQVIADDFICHQRQAHSRRGGAGRVQHGTDQTQPGRHADRGARRPCRRARIGLGGDRVGAFRRNRRRDDRAPRGGLGCQAAQGRLVRALGAHGEVERRPSHRRGAGQFRVAAAFFVSLGAMK